MVHNHLCPAEASSPQPISLACFCLWVLLTVLVSFSAASSHDALAGLLPVEAGLWDCGEAEHVLCTMLMAYPDQAPSLQGLQGVNPDVLAVEDLGTGSGWQQSKQN